MISLKLHIDTEGTKNTFIYKKNISEKLTLVAGIGMMVLLALIFYLIIMMILFYEFPELVILLSPLVVVLFPYGIYRLIKKDILIVDSSTRTCKISEVKFSISNTAAIILDRRYSFTGTGSDSSPAIIWEISIKEKKSDARIIYKHIGSYSCPWIDETAETIAEMMKIPLQDNTGVEPVVRYPGETDTPLKDILKQDGIDSSDADLSIPTELSDKLALKSTDNGFGIFTVHIPIDALSYLKLIIGSILTGLGLLLDYNFLIAGIPFVLEAQNEITQLGNLLEIFTFLLLLLFVFLLIVLFCNIFTLYFGKRLLTSITRSTIIDFTKEIISLRDIGLFLTREKGKIATTEVEKLVLVEKWYNKHTVEFVGHNRRLQLPGEYSLDEAGLINNVITKIFIDLF